MYNYSITMLVDGKAVMDFTIVTRSTHYILVIIHNLWKAAKANVTYQWNLVE